MQHESGVHVFLVAPALTLWGLDRLLRTATPHITLVDSRFTLEEAITALESTFPDVLVLDADDLPEVEPLRTVYERTRIKVVALVSARNSALRHELQAAGVRAEVEKQAAPSSLLRAIYTVSGGVSPGQGDSPFPRIPTAGPPRPVAHEQSIGALTSRERQTISAITADPGAPLKVVADRLHISEHTLRNHLTVIYSKLGLSGRVHLHDFAVRHGLIAPAQTPQLGQSLPLW